MRSDLSLVTVSGGNRRVDLSLPNTVPVAELTPLLAELCAAPADDARPPAWTLSRAGAPPIALAATLAQAGVVDGEVLHLVDIADWGRPRVAEVDPITSALGGGDTRGVFQWAAVRGRALAVVGVAHVVAAAVFVSVSPPLRRPAGPALLAAAAAMICAAFLLAGMPTRRPGGAAGGGAAEGTAGDSGAAARGSAADPDAGRRAGRLSLVAGAAALAVVGGWSVTGGKADAFCLLGGALGLLVTTLVAGPLIPSLVVAGSVVAGMSAASAAALLAGASPVQVAAVTAAIGLIGLRLLPSRVSQRLSRRVAGAEPERIETAAREARTLLSTLSWSGVAVTAAAVAVLAVRGDAFGLGLAAVVGAGLLLRARSYRYPREALPPAVGAGLTLLAVEVAVAARVLPGARLTGVGVALLVVSGVGLAALALRDPKGRALPWWPGWVILDACLAPLLLGATGVFDALAGLLGRLG